MTTNSLKRTPLYESHLALKAKMVDFGGWEMPIAYGSQLDEHHAVRKTAGMFDVSHMLAVDIKGPQARDFLRYLLANDVARLSVPGKAIYSCMLNAQGGVIDDLIVYYFSENDYRSVVNAGCAEKDIAWMNTVRQEKNFDVSIEPRRDLAILAVQGPQACSKLFAARPQWQAIVEGLSYFNAGWDAQTMIARTGYTGEEGVEIVLPATDIVALWQDLLQQDVKPAGLGARDTLRLEAGMNLFGQDMDETVLPGAAGLTWTVWLKDETRQFVGRSALESADLSHKLVGLQLQEKGIMRAHTVVNTEYGAGEVTSGTMSPTMGISIGLARVPKAINVGDIVHVDLRGKAVPAKVCKIPFVRNGAVVDHSA